MNTSHLFLSNTYLALMSIMNIHNESRMHVVEVGPQSMPDGDMRVARKLVSPGYSLATPQHGHNNHRNLHT